MPFFQYRATDSAGRLAEGTISAASVAAARTALTQAGYIVSTLGEAGAPAAPRPATAPPQVAAPVRVAAPVGRPTAVAPRPVVVAPAPSSAPSVPAAPAAPQIVKTKWSRDKELFILFSQLGQYFRAGIAPQEAFHNLANTAKPHFTESLREVERNATEGRRISDIFERYPYLYPPDVVGVTRAGEVSGHLGEAFGSITNQTEASARIKRRLSYFIYLFAGILFVFPIIYSIVTGSLASIAAQDKANGSLPVEGTLISKVMADLSHQILPMTVGTAIFVGLMLLWHSMPLRMLRHRLVLGLPALGGRARAEAIERFTWGLGLVSRGGVAPQTTFTIAATCVPNLVIREQLMNSAKTMLESERLSTALQRSQALPVEYTHIVQTGELTGDVPRALEDIHRATEADLRAREGTTVTVSSVLFYCALGAIVLVMLAFLYRTYASGLITTLTGDS